MLTREPTASQSERLTLLDLTLEELRVHIEELQRVAVHVREQSRRDSTILASDSPTAASSARAVVSSVAYNEILA
jgi:hypothetical protein